MHHIFPTHSHTVHQPLRNDQNFKNNAYQTSSFFAFHNPTHARLHLPSPPIPTHRSASHTLPNHRVNTCQYPVQPGSSFISSHAAPGVMSIRLVRRCPDMTVPAALEIPRKWQREMTLGDALNTHEHGCVMQPAPRGDHCKEIPPECTNLPVEAFTHSERGAAQPCLQEIPLSPLPLNNEKDTTESHVTRTGDASPRSLCQLHGFSKPTFGNAEKCDADIPENKRQHEKAENAVQGEPHAMPEGCESTSLAPTPSMMKDTKTSETGQVDVENPSRDDSTPSPSALDEIGAAQACSRSGSQLDVTVSKRSRSPDECLERSENEVGSPEIDILCHSPSEGDDVVDAFVSNASTSGDDAPKDRDTPAMALCRAGIMEKKITHSRSTPDLKSPHLIVAPSHFDKDGRLAIQRTLSDFTRLETNPGGSKVVTPESHASEDIVQEMDAHSRGEGDKDSLSKSRVGIDIPETPGTIPSGGKMPSDSAEELNQTSLFAVIQDDFVTELSPADPEHRDLSMDSSSASLRQLEPPKSGLAHSTPALGSVDSVCSSSDLERVENGENIKASPREIKRTYSSSVDTLVEEDIETLTTTSIQHTITSRTNSDASHRTTSSLLIGSNESAVYQQPFDENPSDVFDNERDPLSASSLDAEGAWREEHSFPRPHSRVKRMYSSSDSSPDSVADHEEIEISDSVTEALANNQWDAYVSECRRCSSTLEGRELERLSKSGRLPHTGFTSSESMGSLPPQTAERSPLLRRNSSTPVRQRSHSAGRTRRGMKSALAKKAARLLNFVLGKKSRSGKDNPESRAKMKKRSLSSLLCGRSS